MTPHPDTNSFSVDMKLGRGMEMHVFTLVEDKEDETMTFHQLYLANVLSQRDLNYIEALEDAVFDLLAFAENMPGFNIHPKTQKALEFMKTKENRGA